jgi:hypothetical protein
MGYFSTGLVCAAASAVLLSTAAYANDPNKVQRENEYKAAVAHADADYKAAKTDCGRLQGNDKDVCMKDAKAAHVAALEDAKAYRISGQANADARDAKLEARYAAAKERCDALSGDAKDACLADAKLKYHQ